MFRKILCVVWELISKACLIKKCRRQNNSVQGRRKHTKSVVRSLQTSSFSKKCLPFYKVPCPAAKFKKARHFVLSINNPTQTTCALLT